MKLLLAIALVAGLIAPAPVFADAFTDQSFATALAVIDTAPDAPFSLQTHPFPSGGVPAGVGASTPFFTNFVATAPYSSGLPCFNCGTGNNDLLGMAVPYNYVYRDYPQSFVISWTSINFSGSCYVGLTITSGSHVIQRASHTFSGIGNGAYDAFLNVAKIKWSGGALMVAKVKCGPHASTTQAPLLFQ